MGGQQVFFSHTALFTRFRSLPARTVRGRRASPRPPDRWLIDAGRRLGPPSADAYELRNSPRRRWPGRSEHCANPCFAESRTCPAASASVGLLQPVRCRAKLFRVRAKLAAMSTLEHEPCLSSLSLACALHPQPASPCRCSGSPILHRHRKGGDDAYRRPPVWRAVVRPARSFFACAIRGSALSARAARHHFLARRRMIGTNESKSTGFGTCRSNPASIACSTSACDA